MGRRTTLVYAGEGSSHSWTWLADLFESRGICDVRFLDTEMFRESLADDVRAVVVSGGDGLKIASSLGPHGFAHLKGFIHRGGTYIGICAGAYLPLPSSLDPLDKFNVSTTKIENIDPSTRFVSPRIAVRYGSCSIVHPVRGPMELEGIGYLRAPIFGGPIFKEPEHDEVLLRYASFTPETEFQMDRSEAESMVLGRPAALRCRHGLGELVLLGPHLEHPRYPDANDVFLHLPEPGFGPHSTPTVVEDNVDPELSRSIADLKVAILGLENRSFLAGNKLWDGTRFLELVDAIEKRAHTSHGLPGKRIAQLLDSVREEFISTKTESFEFSDEAPELLVEAARVCVDNHFSVLREKG